MSARKMVVAGLLGAASAVAVAPVMGQGTLTGDTRLACEAILCLSSGQRPNECMASLQRYFSIRHRRPSDTFNARRNFLDMCPKGGDAQMNTLVHAIVHGAGACDAVTLNTTLASLNDDGKVVSISNTMPDYCVAYYTHPYTHLAAVWPMYAGDRWVEPADYAAAMADYEARRAAAALAASSRSDS